MEDNIDSSPSFVIETAMVKCRVCQTSLRKKNYKNQLKNQHPEEDSEDLSGKDQRKILSMFMLSNSSRKNVKKGSGKDLDSHEEAPNSDLDQAINIIDDEKRMETSQEIARGESDSAVSESKKRKALEDDSEVGLGRKRFESGDSAFSDSSLIQIEETGNESSNNTKFDLILQELQYVKNEIRELKKDKKSSNEEIKEAGLDKLITGEENVLSYVGE